MTSCLLTEVAILMDYHNHSRLPLGEKDGGGSISEPSSTSRSADPKSHTPPPGSQLI